MNVNVINQNPFLDTSRRFPPDELSELAFHMNIAYVDIANSVNTRVISLFPTSRPAVTGEQWFISARRPQSSFRQVYTFTSTASITHNIDFDNLDRFTIMYGTFTNGTNWFGLIPSTQVAIAGSTSFYVTPTQIVFVVGAGSPVLSKGNIVLEWLSQA